MALVRCGKPSKVGGARGRDREGEATPEGAQLRRPAPRHCRGGSMPIGKLIDTLQDERQDLVRDDAGQLAADFDRRGAIRHAAAKRHEPLGVPAPTSA